MSVLSGVGMTIGSELTTHYVVGSYKEGVRSKILSELESGEVTSETVHKLGWDTTRNIVMSAALGGLGKATKFGLARSAASNSATVGLTTSLSRMALRGLSTLDDVAARLPKGSVARLTYETIQEWTEEGAGQLHPVLEYAVSIFSSLDGINPEINRKLAKDYGVSINAQTGKLNVLNLHPEGKQSLPEYLRSVGVTVNINEDGTISAVIGEHNVSFNVLETHTKKSFLESVPADLKERLSNDNAFKTLPPGTTIIIDDTLPTLAETVSEQNLETGEVKELSFLVVMHMKPYLILN